MKGFTKDGKFRPIKPYQKVRKSRDNSTKEQGVKIRKERDTSEYCLACGKKDLDPYGRCEKCGFDPQSLRDQVEVMVIRDLETRPHMTMENEEFGDLVDKEVERRLRKLGKSRVRKSREMNPSCAECRRGRVRCEVCKFKDKYGVRKGRWDNGDDESSRYVVIKTKHKDKDIYNPKGVTRKFASAVNKELDRGNFIETNNFQEAVNAVDSGKYNVILDTKTNDLIDTTLKKRDVN